MLAFFTLFLFYINSISGEYEPWIEEFEHWTYLDSEDKYILYWTPDTDDCSIEFGVEVETSGWIGLGISSTGNMFPADVVIGWVDDSTNEAYLNNHYTTAKALPKLFEDQTGIALIEGFQNEINGTTITYLRFVKELFPSQYRDHAVDVQIGTTKVIFAFNDNDPSDNDPTQLEQHSTSDRGPKSLNLLSGDTKEIPLPEDADYFDLLQQQAEVPSKDTTYWCTLLEVPQFNATQHIIRIDPIIEEGNEAIVHHYGLWVCPEEFADPDWVNIGFDCDDAPNMATNLTHCKNGQFMYAWAVGGGNFHFPENVGLEFGNFKYVLFETHYDNPLEVEGHIDSSGMRLWYTPTLREYHAGILSVQDEYDQFIPPNIESTWNYAYLTGECSEQGFPDEGVHVFAAMHHQHLLGRAGKLRHIRDNQELPPIDINLGYDFNFQQYVPLKEEVLLLPGDELIVECKIDSTGRDSMTIGGQRTSDEMCMTFMFVWPKPKLQRSSSSFVPADKAEFFIDAEGKEYYNPETNDYDVGIEGALEFYDEFQLKEDRFLFCMSADGEVIVPDGEIVSIPSDFKEYDGDNHFGCIKEREEDETSVFEWDSWYVYMTAAIIGVLLIGLIIYMGFKCRKKKDNDTMMMYQEVEYGATNNN